MLAVGGNDRLAHGEEVDQRGGGVDERVDKARQQRDRVGADPNDELGRDQHRRDGEGGGGRAPPHPARRGWLAQEKSRVWRQASPSRVTSTRSCSRNGRSCQNSMRS